MKCPVAGYQEHRNEPSASIREWEISLSAKRLLASQDEMFCIELYSLFFLWLYTDCVVIRPLTSVLFAKPPAQSGEVKSGCCIGLVAVKIPRSEMLHRMNTRRQTVLCF